jgi:hypothetical protein
MLRGALDIETCDRTTLRFINDAISKNAEAVEFDLPPSSV